MVINPSGKIVAFMRPASLTKQMLADLVRGEDIELPSERYVAAGKVVGRISATESMVEAEDELAHAVIRYSSAREKTVQRILRSRSTSL